MIKIDKNKTVSFDIDAVNGFTPNCPDELPVEDGDLIAPELNRNATKAKYRYASKDAHPNNGAWKATEKEPQLSVVGLKNVDIRWNNHSVVGTYGFELLLGLPHMSEYDFFIYKGAERDMHPYSPCYHDLDKNISTGVIEKAKHDGITTFILGGLALDFCLGEGAIDLAKAGFSVIINLAATKAIGDAQEFIDKVNAMNLDIIFISDSTELDSE